MNNINFGLNKYCGPSVISALTGRSTDECASIIQSISGQREIKAVAVDHIYKALNKLRFKTIKVEPKANSLYGNLVMLENGTYLILVPRHIVAVEKQEGSITLIDNHTRIAINAAMSARLMQHVEQIVKIVAMAEVMKIVDVLSKWCKDNISNTSTEREK
jgi:hypothetical protein